MTITTDLTRALDQEISAVERFVALLTQEQEALRSGLADVIATLVEQKSVLTETLIALATTRNALLAAAGYPADGDGLLQWEQAAGGGSAGRRERLLGLARQARELNTLNGQLIATRLNHTTAALSVLTADSSGGALYGRDGQANTRTGYRIIDSA